MENLPLGRQVELPDHYWPEILAPIPREQSRRALDVSKMPFQGWDRWLAWEFAWHDLTGMRNVGVLEICVPAASPRIFESKSLKLFLNSCFYRRFIDLDDALDEVRARLENICGMPIDLRYLDAAETSDYLQVEMQPQGFCLDQLAAGQASTSIAVRERGQGIRELYYSHLFRSLCPVTGQPDWATVFVEVVGVALEQRDLLNYLLGYTNHQGFHESCVEKIFMDIWRQCQPAQLAVTARYTRRGGIEIDPYRTSSTSLPEHNQRQFRQ